MRGLKVPGPTNGMRHRPALVSLAILVAGAGFCGCGQGEFTMAPVSGTAICDGKPLTWGEVVFTPRPEGEVVRTGKQATGQIGPDGRFELTTYEQGDGAVIGRHEVQILPDGDRGQFEAYPCQMDGGYFVEVEEKDNDFTIEVTAKKGRRR